MSAGARRVRALIALSLVAVLLPIGQGHAQSPWAGTLFPFSLPWDDASPGPTDLSGWNQPIAGEADRLRVGPDGHFYRGTERVRLFGFDVSAGAPMADRGVAERVAARLAKFGVNYVRIAQNSQPAPQGWIDPATLAGVDPEALDRLDYFIAQLRRRGIYVHLVLNHFRRFYPRDVPGFEGGRTLPDGWPRWGTGVTQFFTPVIAHNRAISRQILTHRNPHTGLTYAEDPAIAIVEITNEDGLVRLWQGGAIDPIISAGAPHLVPLRDELVRRWNRWLRERYGTDADLRATWDRGALPHGGELLANGDFRQGTQGWRLATVEGARALWQIAPGAGPVAGAPVLQIQVERVGTEPWHVMVVQDRLPLQEGRPYRIDFWARASGTGAKMALNVQQAQSPSRVLSSTVELSLSDRWEHRTLIVTPTASEANAKVNLIRGYQAQTIWLAGLSVQEAAVVGLRAQESALAGSVPAFSRAEFALRTPRAQQDWMAFLFAVEERFFADELHFLRDELKV
ncbi:MAG: carbohydrate binding domain-containing protein, partial [Armatimonadota bacterium]|nr:carbohydrate binding domain-containing protein [Armatimonadota bacterium]